LTHKQFEKESVEFGFVFALIATYSFIMPLGLRPLISLLQSVRRV